MVAEADLAASAQAEAGVVLALLAALVSAGAVVERPSQLTALALREVAVAPGLLAALALVGALVAEAEPEALPHLLSRRSSSAAMARTLRQRTAPSDLVPRSR